MRDSMKITVGYQFLRILLIALAGAGIVFIFGVFIFYQFTDMNIAKQILSVALMGVEFALLYTTSKNLAAKDIKPYTPLKPSKVKGVLFGAQIAVLNVIFVIIFSLIWQNCTKDNVLVGVVPIALNAIFYFWSFAYNGLMTDYLSGNVGYIAIAAMIVMPIAATTLGYVAGCKKFDITEKMDSLIYEKEEDRNDEQQH